MGGVPDSQIKEASLGEPRGSPHVERRDLDVRTKAGSCLQGPAHDGMQAQPSRRMRQLLEKRRHALDAPQRRHRDVLPCQVRRKVEREGVQHRTDFQHANEVGRKVAEDFVLNEIPE